jgi:hypothetical protein
MRENYRYNKDKKTISAFPARALQNKLSVGAYGKIGALGMRIMRERDLSENGELYRAAVEERRALREKRLTYCAICGKEKKQKWFRICYECRMKKKNL